MQKYLAITIIQVNGFNNLTNFLIKIMKLKAAHRRKKIKKRRKFFKEDNRSN